MDMCRKAAFAKYTPCDHATHGTKLWRFASYYLIGPNAQSVVSASQKKRSQSGRRKWPTFSVVAHKG